MFAAAAEGSLLSLCILLHGCHSELLQAIHLLSGSCSMALMTSASREVQPCKQVKPWGKMDTKVRWFQGWLPGSPKGKR